ncbi:hypothetical protein [Caudoviricetes sp.]|nr:hypothetical protein [Caudoviricetes sp.]
MSLGDSGYGSAFHVDYYTDVGIVFQGFEVDSSKMSKVAALLDQLEKALEEAQSSAATVDRVAELIEKKRKLSESISRRTRELKLTLSIREVDTFVNRLLVILTEELEQYPELSERVSSRIREAAGVEDDDEV